MKPQLLIFVTLLNFAASAFASCDNGSKTIFSCLSTKGKQIELCDAGKTINYSFGKAHLKPDLALAVQRASATTTQGVE